jgi:hypothetical protein
VALLEDGTGYRSAATPQARNRSFGLLLRFQCILVAGLRGRAYQRSFVMPRSPSLVPQDYTRHDIYLVLDDFGSLGRSWRETDEAGTNRATLIRNLLEDQYENPVRIVAFNTAEGWSRDVTVDIADELRRRYVEYVEVPASILKFVETANRH